MSPIFRFYPSSHSTSLHHLPSASILCPLPHRPLHFPSLPPFSVLREPSASCSLLKLVFKLEMVQPPPTHTHTFLPPSWPGVTLTFSHLFPPTASRVPSALSNFVLLMESWDWEGKRGGGGGCERARGDLLAVFFSSSFFSRRIPPRHKWL